MRLRSACRLLAATFCAWTMLTIGGSIVHANAAPHGTSPAISTTSASYGQATSDGHASGSDTTSQTQALQSDANAQLDSLPTQTIDQYWRRLAQEYGGYLPDVSGDSIVHAVFGGGGISLQSMVRGMLRYLFSELFDNAELLGGILTLSVLAALLESLQSAFERQTVSQVAYAVVFMVLMVLAIGSFTEAIGYGKHAIQAMSDFMLASIPVMVGLLAASGAMASAAFFHPLMLFTVHLVSNVVFLFVFPLIFFSAVLDITSALSPRYQLTRLAGLLRTFGVAALGICLSVFIGISTVQGAGKGIVDGVTLRVAKSGAKLFLPVIGSAMSDAMDTVASASLLVKNAVGVAGLIVVACIAVFPAFKILVLSFVYSGGAALMQPLGDNPMVNCLGAIGKSMVLVFASVAAVALMFFISICMLILTASLAVGMA